MQPLGHSMHTPRPENINPTFKPPAIYDHPAFSTG